ncbi:TPA: glycosyltransferase [Vibrio diabolicus]|nr:glycosyltransferase [Vibrio diabolicus]
MKKIAFLIDRLTGGGVERVVSNLSMMFGQSAEQFIILKHEDITFPHNAKIICLKNKTGPLLFKEVYDLKKKYRFDSVISLSVAFNIVNALTKVGEQTILTEHQYRSSIFRGYKKELFNLIVRYIYNRADVIAPVSCVVEKDLVENYGLLENKSIVIYNPFFEPKHHTRNFPLKFGSERPIRLLNVGRLTGQKSQWHLIRVAEHLRELNVNFIIEIYGDGELRTDLSNLIKEKNLDDKVILKGYSDNMASVYLESDIFILCSKFEAFPMVLGEAMNFGLPIVSSDCLSGPKEFLSRDDFFNRIRKTEFSDFGVLVPAFDLTQDIVKPTSNNVSVERRIALVVRKFYLNPELLEEYSELSRVGVNRFNKHNILQKWESVLELR